MVLKLLIDLGNSGRDLVRWLFSLRPRGPCAFNQSQNSSDPKQFFLMLRSVSQKHLYSENLNNGKIKINTKIQWSPVGYPCGTPILRERCFDDRCLGPSIAGRILCTPPKFHPTRTVQVKNHVGLIRRVDPVILLGQAPEMIDVMILKRLQAWMMMMLTGPGICRLAWFCKSVWRPG